MTPLPISSAFVTSTITASVEKAHPEEIIQNMS
jgi:hypothetical protein